MRKEPFVKFANEYNENQTFLLYLLNEWRRLIQ